MTAERTIRTPSGLPVVELIDHMGNDLTVVNAARVSFHKKKDAIDDKDRRLIEYLAAHGHWCYDDETEILTTRGWVKFEDLTKKDLVAQVDNWDSCPEISFVYTQKIHRSFYEGPMYLCESPMVNYCVTPRHRMLLRKRSSKGWKDWEILSSDETFGMNKKFLLSAELSRKEGYGTYWEGFYLGFILGDGGRVSKNSIVVRLKLERKIRSFETCLNKLKKNYKKVVDKNGVCCFYVEDSDSDLAKGKNRKFPDLESKSSEFIKGLFFGLVESDGSVKRGGFSFKSNSLSLVEGFSLLATLCGYNSSKIRVFRKGSKTHNTTYIVEALTRKTANVNINTTKNGMSVKRKDERIVNYKGWVYCVSVPSGMVMVRRKGRQMVCGNTPFGHCMITFIFRMPICIARQWFRHTVGLVRNEMSRRYVDDPPEFMEPIGLRKRAPRLKQGSLDETVKEIPYVEFGEKRLTGDDLVALSSAYYDALIDAGVAPEVARFYLPQGTLTEFWETGSLAAYARIVKLRLDDHAQLEVRRYAELVSREIEKIFPISWQALMKYA